MNGEQLYRQLKSGQINKSQLTNQELGDVYKYMVDSKKVSVKEIKPETAWKLGLSTNQYKPKVEEKKETPTIQEEEEISFLDKIKNKLSGINTSTTTTYPLRGDIRNNTQSIQQPRATQQTQTIQQPSSANPEEELADVLSQLSTGNTQRSLDRGKMVIHERSSLARPKDENEITTKDRFNSVINSVKNSVTGSYLSGAGTIAEYGQRGLQNRLMQEEQQPSFYDQNLKDNTTVTPQYSETEKALIMDALKSDKTHFGDEYLLKSQQYREQAQEGLGPVGKFAVDLGIGTGELLGDIGVGAVTGTGVLPALGFRSFGQGASQARQEGASLEQQIGYGAVSGGIEVATELLVGGLLGAGKITNKGIADDLIFKTSTRLSKMIGNSPRVAKGLIALGNMAGEGAEEAISEVLSPIAQMLIYNPEADLATGEEILYSALLGAGISGVMGGGVVGNKELSVDIDEELNPTPKHEFDINNYHYNPDKGTSSKNPIHEPLGAEPNVEGLQKTVSNGLTQLYSQLEADREHDNSAQIDKMIESLTKTKEFVPALGRFADSHISILNSYKTRATNEPQTNEKVVNEETLNDNDSVAQNSIKDLGQKKYITVTSEQAEQYVKQAVNTLKAKGIKLSPEDINYMKEIASSNELYNESEPMDMPKYLVDIIEIERGSGFNIQDEMLSEKEPNELDEIDTKDTIDTIDTVDNIDTIDTVDTSQKPKDVQEYKLPSLIYPSKISKEDEISNRQVHKEIKRELNNFSKYLAKSIGYEYDTDKKGKPEYSNVGHMDASIILWKPNTDYGIYLSFNYAEVPQGKDFNYNSAVKTEGPILYRVTKKNDKYKGLTNNYYTFKNSEHLTVSEIAPVIEKLVDNQIAFDERKAKKDESKPKIDEAEDEFFEVMRNDATIYNAVKNSDKQNAMIEIDNRIKENAKKMINKYSNLGNTEALDYLTKKAALQNVSNSYREKLYDEILKKVEAEKSKEPKEQQGNEKYSVGTVLTSKSGGTYKVKRWQNTLAILTNTENETDIVVPIKTLDKDYKIKTEEKPKAETTIKTTDIEKLPNNIDEKTSEKNSGKARDNLSALEALAAEAEQRIKEKSNRLYSGLPLDLLYDYAIVGAYHIAHDVADFTDWSKQMVDKYGANIKEHLRDIYEQSNALLDMSIDEIKEMVSMVNEVKDSKPKDVEEITVERVKKEYYDYIYSDKEIKNSVKNDKKEDAILTITNRIRDYHTTIMKNYSFLIDEHKASSSYLFHDIVQLNDKFREPSSLEKLYNEVKEKIDVENKGNIQPMVDFLKKKIADNKKITSSELYQLANVYYGGLQTSGTYKTKDAYELLEVALNKYIEENFNLNSSTSKEKVLEMLTRINKILQLIPTQINRDTEQIEKQQFSTPPNISLVAGWLAKISMYDSVLEPSAGNGGLSVWGLTANAEVTVNEIDKTRRNHLKMFDYDHVFKENAELINLILPKEIKPTVVIMNPPFSTAFDNTKTKDNDNIKKHIEQALERLQDGGRAVIITGRTLADGKPKFSGWWKKIKSNYNLQANVTINGKNYKKYGTTFDIQMIVIDKTGMTHDGYVTGEYDNLEDVIEALEGVRNERQRPNRNNQDVSGNEQSTNKPGSNNDDEKVPQGGLASSTGNDSSSTGSTRGDGHDGNRGPRGSRTGTSTTTVQQEGDNQISGADSGIDNGNRGPANDTRGNTGNENASGTKSVPTGNSQVGDNVETIKVEQKEVEASDQTTLDEDRVFEQYKPAKLNIKGAKEHPAELVESAAMKAVLPPDVKYQPHLPLDIIKKGLLSEAQLEAIVYAGQSHSQKLPNGHTRGFFIGDGTGVGKGREIAGIIYDNYLQGRKKAVWITENQKLIKDANRDLTEIGWEGYKLVNTPKKGKKFADKEGVLVTTYGTLRNAFKKEVSKDGAGYKFEEGNRIKQLYDWLGPDYDGVIAFDEAHNMKSALSVKKDGSFGKTKVSDTAAMGHILHNLMPKAKIVYVSATGAVNIEDLTYAERLGLWGTGTPFPTPHSFVSEIGSGGLAAMELVCRDMKSMGLYIARSISFNGVEYDRLEHTLSKEQRIMYDRIAEAWQVILDNFEKAVDFTQMDTKQRGAALRTFWGNNQRFFNQVITSMQMPSVIEDVKKQLADNKSVVLQIVSTGEAAQERKIEEAIEDDVDLEELDFTPREMLINYLLKYFPVQQCDWTIDDNGKPISKPVTDSEGNPVLNPSAVALRDGMIADFNDMPIPEDVLTILFDEFGSSNVAEITGRSRRVVYKENEKTGVRERVIEKISDNAGVAEEENFMSGKKRILVFSNAGGTGRSYHASRNAKNQEQRVHYLIEAGYSAMKAIQGFGRTHRSNESSAPLYRLVSTDLSGQKRFISTIARRLGQLGAMTKGQRQTSSGIFTEKDNLEGPLASSALANFYRDLVSESIDGLNKEEVLKKMGLADIIDQNGNLSESNAKVRKISNFLNRILSLTVDMQNQVFAEFEGRLSTAMDYAIQTGTLDVGLEVLKGDSIEVIDRQLVRENKELNTKTELIKLKVGEKVRKTRFDELSAERLKGYYRNEKSGSIRAVYTLGMNTKTSGSVVERIRFVGQAIHQNKIDDIDTLTDRNSNWVEVSENEAISLWDEAYKDASNIRYDNIYMVTGTLLPIWDRLPTDRTRVMRTITNEGEQLLGRILSNSQLQTFMQKAGINIQKDKYTSKLVYDEVYRHNKVAHLENGWKIIRSKVNKEYRLELTNGKFYFYTEQFKQAGLFNEIVNFTNRWFIPVNENTEKILDDFLKYHDIISITEADDNSLSYKGKSNKNYSGSNGTGNNNNDINNNNDDNDIPVVKADMSRPLLDVDKIKRKASKLFNVTISDKTERFRKSNALGYYKPFPEVIRTKYHSQLGVIMHELGHHLDKKYEFSKINPAIIQAMIDKMDDGFRKAYKEYKLPGEAVAEFLRYYMTDIKTAVDFGGTFYQKFESTLDKKDIANIQDLRADILRWMQAEWVDKAKTTMVSANDVDKKSFKERYAAEERTMLLYDDLIPIDNFAKTVESLSGKRLRPEENPYFIALMTRRNSSIIDGILRGKTIDTQYKVINDTDSLEKIIDDVGENIEMFELYLKLKHALTLEDRGHQVMPDDIEVTEDRLYAIEQTFPEFEEKAERLYKWYNTFFKAWVVDTKMMGPNSKKIYEVMRERYPYYVPMFRSRKSLVGDNSLKKSKNKFTDQKNVVDRLTEKGSDKPTIYPLESIISQVNRMVNAYTKNNVMRTIVKNYSSDEGLGIFLDKVAPDIEKQLIPTNALKEKLEEKLEDEYELKLTSKEIDDILDSIDDILVGYRPLQTSKDSDIVTVIAENGKRQFYEVFDANLLKALTNMDKKQLDFLAQTVSALRRKVTALTTGSNPLFAIFSNAPRDIQQAYVYGSYINPLEYGFEVGKALFESLIKSEEYKDFVSMGAGYAASMYGADRKAADKLSKKLMKRRNGTKSSPKEMLDFLVEVIEMFNDAVEIAPRMAEYNKAYKIAKQKGMDEYNAKLQALTKSNDVTLNFLKKGTIMNTAWSQGIPFLNAGLQGIDKLKRSLSDKETKNQVLIKSIISLTLPTILLWLRFKDDEDYKNLSKGIKDNYWIVHKNEDGSFVRIPKPKDLSILFSADFERGLESYFNKQGKEAFDGFMYTVSNSLLPSLDSISRPIIDVGKNQKWSGGPIVSQNLMDLLKKDQYDDTTSRIAVYFSRAVAVAFPDSKLASPKNMDYLLDQYFGGIADILLPTTTPNGYTTAEFIRRKFNADPVFSNDSIDKFYELREKTINANNSWKEKGTITKDVDFVAQKELNAYYNAISAYWKGIDGISRIKETTVLAPEQIELFKGLIENSKYVKETKEKLYSDLADKKIKRESIKLFQRIIRDEIVTLTDKAVKEYNKYHKVSNQEFMNSIKEE